MVKYLLEQFETIGSEYAKKLKNALNIETVDDFYSFSIEDIQEKTGIESKRIEQFADVLDLFRVPKITARDAELLFNANINSVVELSHRQAIRIFYKLKQIDEESYLIIIDLPSFAQLEEWIYFAKTMTKRIKNGTNMPLILLPMMNLDKVSDLAPFGIYTIEDLLYKKSMISGLRRKLDMTREEYENLFELIDLIKIEGIDIYFATIFHKAGIDSVKKFKSMATNEILKEVQKVQSNEQTPLEIITSEIIEDLKKKMENN